MFERFNYTARDAVVHANMEARRLKHNYIGTEHLLLGLLCIRSEISDVLRAGGLTISNAREHVRKIVGEGDEALDGQIPFTPRAKKVLELGLREALSSGHNHVACRHILAAMQREGEGVAYRILAHHGLEEAADVHVTVNERGSTRIGGREEHTAMSIAYAILTGSEATEVGEKVLQGTPPFRYVEVDGVPFPYQFPEVNAPAVRVTHPDGSASVYLTRGRDSAARLLARAQYLAGDLRRILTGETA